MLSRVSTLGAGRQGGWVLRPSRAPGACPAHPHTSQAPAAQPASTGPRRAGLRPRSQPRAPNGLGCARSSLCPAMPLARPASSCFGGCSFPGSVTCLIASARPRESPGAVAGRRPDRQLFPCRLAPPRGRLGHHLPPGPPLCGGGGLVEKKEAACLGRGPAGSWGLGKPAVRAEMSGLPGRALGQLEGVEGAGPHFPDPGLQAGLVVNPNTGGQWVLLSRLGPATQVSMSQVSTRPRTARRSEGPPRVL